MPRKPADTNCAFCNWYHGLTTIAELKTDVPTPALCLDAYTAVSDSEVIVKELSTLTKEWESKYQTSYDSAVSAFTVERGGFYSLKDYFTEELRQKGMILSSADIEKYLTYKSDPQTWNWESPKFDNEDTCKDDMASWTMTSPKSDDLMTNNVLRRKRFTERWQREMTSIIQYTPVLFLEKVVESCGDLEKSHTHFDSLADNWMKKKFVERRNTLLDLPFCKNPLKVRILNAQIAAREAPEFTEKELKEIVEPHLPLFTIIDGFDDFTSLNTEISDINAQFFVTQAAWKNSCESLSQYQRSAVDELYEQTLSDMKNSKPFIEKAIGYYFESYRKTEIMNNFNQAKAGVLTAIQTLIPDVAAANQVTESVNATELVWPDIQNIKYKTAKHWNGNTITVVDEDAMETDDPFWTIREMLMDKSQNAFYDAYTNPEKKKIYVQPATVWFGLKAPMALLAVVAHELGHDVYEQNKELTHPAIDPIMKCMAAKESILLKKAQWSEAAADIVSEVATSKLVSQLGVETERKAAAIQMTLFFPFIDVDSSSLHSPSDPHPDTVLRVSGIFSSAQGFRNNAGCGKEVSNYKVCL